MLDNSLNVDELAGGLRNALDRGQSLESAKRSFINAGYTPETVAIAVAHLKQEGIVEKPQHVPGLKIQESKKPGFFKRLFSRKKVSKNADVQKISPSPVKTPIKKVVKPISQTKPIPAKINISDAQLERMLASRRQSSSSKAIATPIYTINKKPSELHEQISKKPGFFKKLFSRKKKVQGKNVSQKPALSQIKLKENKKKNDKLKNLAPAEVKKAKPLPKSLNAGRHGYSKPLPKLFFIIMIIVSLLILVGAAVLGLYWDQLFR